MTPREEERMTYDPVAETPTSHRYNLTVAI